MSNVTVTLLKGTFIAGAAHAAGESVSVSRSLAAEMITSGIARKPADWENESTPVVAQQNPFTGGISLLAGGVDVLTGALVRTGFLRNRPMASAPTITTSAANAAAGAGTTTRIEQADSRITYFGARQVSAVNWGYYRNESVTSTLDRGNFFFYEFCTDASVFELCFVFDGSLYGRVWVDGEPIQAYTTQIASSSGTYQYRIDFGSRAPRTITVMQTGGFAGVYLGATDTIWKSERKYNRKVAVIGDSWATGGTAATAFAYEFGIECGIDDLYVAGQSGTGYINPGSGGGRQKFGDRLSSDVVPYAPDDLIIVGSINDSAYTPTQVASAASALYASAAMVLPNTRLIVVGIQYPSASAAPTSDAINTAVQAAALASANVAAYISTSGWITGTGRVGATTGSGNADVYRNTDSNHLTESGYRYWGGRIANECKRLRLYP